MPQYQEDISGRSKDESDTHPPCSIVCKVCGTDFEVLGWWHATELLLDELAEENKGPSVEVVLA